MRKNGNVLSRMLSLLMVLAMVLGMLPAAVFAVEATYIVAGEETLCGSAWEAADPNNKMQPTGDGKYAIVYTNVAVGKYELKVTDGSWDNSWGDGNSNLTFLVGTACDVTITFDPATQTVTATGSGLTTEVIPFDVETISAVGDGSVAWLEGKYWDVGGNIMAETPENVFQITYAGVAAGSYEVKFAANQSWDDSWGGIFAGNGQQTQADYGTQNNIAFTLPEGSWDVTLKLDLTAYDHATKQGAKFTITWVEAQEDKLYYLDPGTHWTGDNTRFAIYAFAGSENTWISMTDPDGDGIYQAAVPENYTTLIFCQMKPNTTENSWDNKMAQTTDQRIPTDGSDLFTISNKDGAGAWSKLGEEPEEDQGPSYFVAGDAALCGINWDAAAAANKMQPTGDGKYQLVYANVAPGEYGLKVTDGTWDNSWGDNGQNFNIKVVGQCDVTITFDPETKTVTATGDGLAGADAPFDVETIGAVGSGSDAWLEGKYWDVGGNIMAETPENVFQITYAEVAAGSYEVKFAADKAWTHSWGGTIGENGVAAEAVYNGENIALTLPEGSWDVTLKLDLTAYDHATKQGAKFTITWTEHVEAPEPEAEYYLVGIINGTDHSTAQEALKFVDGKLRLTVDTDSRVAVLSSNSDILYMTSGWLSNVTSAVLTQERTDAKPGQLPIPAGATYDLTLVENDDGTLTLSYAEAPKNTYYLAGYLNGADVTQNLEGYRFDGGKLTVSLKQTGYAIIRDQEGNQYLSQAFCQSESTTLKQGWNEKLQVPGGIELTFTLVENDDGTLTLSYELAQVEVPEDAEYYLVGYLNGADVVDTRPEYKFADGKLKVTFDAVSYVQVKNSSNMLFGTQSYCQSESATLKQGWGEKMQVPGGIELTFTLVKNADGTLGLGYELAEVEVPEDAEYYLVGYLNGADLAETKPEYKFVDGKLNVKFNQDSYVQIKSSGNLLYGTQEYCQSEAGTFKLGGSEKMWVPGNADLAFTLTVNDDGTLGLSYQATMAPLTDDWYLVGYINGRDYGIGADAANLGRFKFKDGVVCTGFGSDSYVAVKNGNGQLFMCETYCQTDIATLKPGWNEKMRVPGNVGVNFFLTFKEDGSLILNYYAYTITPAVPQGYNKVMIHFLRPNDWGKAINAWVWDANGALPGFEMYQTAWPGSQIPENANHKGWFDVVLGTREPQAFNFIFNDGSKQTADLYTGPVTGPTELWVVGNNVYTEAPKQWTHANVTVHYKAPEGWSRPVNAWAASDGSELLGAEPGTATQVTPNIGWYTTSMDVEIGKGLTVSFSSGSEGSGQIDLGTISRATEIWLKADGSRVKKPLEWKDISRTVHVPGTFPGPSWDSGSNRMQFNPDLGLYELTFKAVAPGSYEYKIAINGGWDENYGADGAPGGSNITVSVPEKQDVTVWYSDISHRSVCSVNYDISASAELSGTGIDGAVKLTDPTLSGRFTARVKLPAGTHKDITVTFGGYSYTFAPFTLGYAQQVTFCFDGTTHIATHSAGSAKVSTGKLHYDTRDPAYKSVFGAVATGQEVTFALTTGTDATQVTLAVPGAKTVALHKDGEAEKGVQRWSCTTSFDTLGEFGYYFAVSNDMTTATYCDDKQDAFYGTGDYGTGTANARQLLPYDLVVYDAGFKTPDWMKNAVIYQIFPDRFFDGDPANNAAQTDARGSVDYEQVSDWYLLPENPEAEGKSGYPVYAMKGDGQWSNEIYGGDLKGITQRMDYLKALGVNVIYLNPVFSSISSHRYDACDYTRIDPILGTLGDFEELVKAAEDNGMKIVLDGVFNHVSDDSVYFDRYYKYLGTSNKVGAYPYWAYVYDYMAEKGVSIETAESAARTYFTDKHGITDYGYTEWFAISNETGSAVDNIGQRAGKSVYTYEGWWGFDSMPVIKATAGSEYQTGTWAQEIIANAQGSAVAQYWISQGNDGWRLDVANEVSDETWQSFRDSVKALSSDAVIVGEIWFDATHYLLGDMYDSVMNYVFRDAVAGFARGYLINRDNKAEKWDSDYTAADAIATLELLRERYPQEAFQAMMNLVGSHDTARILSYLDGVEDDRHQKDMANAFPTYEATSQRAKDLQHVVSFIQFTYPGAPTIYYGDEIGMVGADDPDNRRAFTWGKGSQELVTWYARLAAIRAEYPALRTGTVEPFAPSRDVLGYTRSDGTDTLVVLANRADKEAKLTLDTRELGLAEDVQVTDLITGATFTAKDGKLTITVAACSGAILTANPREVTVDTAALAPAYDPQHTVG